ncbi:hypothetical protein ABZ891_18220 [Streptomyces sp. NPDC047023]|uniref:hypothetical protein n=1 Tax=Streptomyces sp. NPDC047023 TaxID=3155139 RepID=UPI0033E6719B
MQEPIGAMAVRDRIHTLAVSALALLLTVFSRKRMQNMLDQAARTTEALGGRPRSCNAA